MDEYRLWITVRDLPVSAESAWKPLIAGLEERHGDLGPVLSWEGPDVVVIMATQADGEAHAAQVGVDAVADALHRAGLGDRYPAGVEVERVEEREFQPA